MTFVRNRFVFLTLSLALIWIGIAQLSHAADTTTLGNLKGRFTATTVPKSNGDTNPHGVAVVPEGFGAIHGRCGDIGPGSTLVSNFSNSAGLQGTGSTIAMICHAGNTFNFFQGNSGLGMTGALAILKSGFVIVGNMPTTDGTCATVKSGSLLVIDENGKLVQTLSSRALLNGPWGLAIHDEGSKVLLFVSNVLTGTVTRLRLSVTSKGVVVKESTQIASGYLHRCDTAALEIGPTGLAYDSEKDLLYVASTGDNAIYAIRNAGSRWTHDVKLGDLVYTDPGHLHGPLGLALAPGGHLLTSNGDAVNPDRGHSSELVEFTTGGEFVRQLQLDPAPGAAFGIAFGVVDHETRFETVNDLTNSLQAYQVQ